MKKLLTNLVTLSYILLIIACHSKSVTKREKTVKVDSVRHTFDKEQSFIKEDSLIGLKFMVDDVQKNDTLLEIFSAKKVIENFIGKEVRYYPYENDSVLKLVPISGNGLINTINLCYGQHRPLVLSPDIIWMTIAQGVSTHINKNFVNLERNLFKRNKPKILKVRNDSLEYGEKHWRDLITALADSTKKYTQDDMFSFMVPRFSTTSSEIHIAYQANVLYTYKKAFTYVGEGGCGIPYITVTGTKDDWITIKKSLPKLNELGLSYWSEELHLIIDKFISLYDNEIDVYFWKNIYKEYSDYGEYSISGWIIKFFPYMEVLGSGVYDEELQMMKLNHEFVKNEFLEGDKYLYSTLNIDDFPNYKSETTLIWLNYLKNEKNKVLLYSGIMGAKQYKDGSLQPWITWATSFENEPEAERLVNVNGGIIHRTPNWTPYVFKNDSTVVQKAIYPIKKGIEFDESVSEFKNVINEIIGDTVKYKRDSLTFYILSNGKPLVITDNKKLEYKIQNWLDQNGVKWEPAKIKLSQVMMMPDSIDSSKLIEVNSKIDIILNK